MSPQFQFHSGSIQTLSSLPAKSSTCHVSIPLWFDSNGGTRDRDRRDDVVSIPLWFDSNLWVVFQYCMFSSFQFHSGSIQTGVAIFASMSFTKSFQFHSGSIQTLRHRALYQFLLLFQFHSGSIQTWQAAGYLPRVFQFQFHSGSIQTCHVFNKVFEFLCFNSTLVRFKHVALARYRTIRRRVSIPLWFDSNQRGVAYDWTVLR